MPPFSKLKNHAIHILGGKIMLFKRQEEEENPFVVSMPSYLPQRVGETPKAGAPQETRTDVVSMPSYDTKDLNVWKAWPRDWEDMGKLEKVFSILNRGQHASANVTWSLLNGDGNLAKSAWDGLSGQQRGDYIDILKHYDIPWAPILGTILNIGLDPTTYLTGPLTVFKMGVKKVGQTKAMQEAISMIADSNVYKMLDNAFNIHAGIPKLLGENTRMHSYQLTARQHSLVKDIENFFGAIPKTTKEMIFGHIQKGTSPDSVADFKIYQDYIERWAGYTERAVSEKLITEAAARNMKYVPVVARGYINDWSVGQNLLGPAKKVGFSLEKKTKLMPEDLRLFSDTYLDLSTLNSRGEILAKATDYVLDKNHPATQELLDNLDSMFKAKWGGNIKKVKRELKKLSDYWQPVEDIQSALNIYGINLVRAEQMHRFRDYVFKSSDSPLWSKNWEGGNLPRGETIWAELGPVKRYMKNEVLPAMKDMKKGETFKGIPKEEMQKIANWLFGTGDPATRGVKEAARVEFADMMWMPKEFATTLRLADGGRLPIYQISEEVADHLKRAKDLFEGGPEVDALLKVYDKSLHWWKRWATVMRLPFHARNFVGNTTRAYMAGVSPKDMPGLAKISAEIQIAGMDMGKAPKNLIPVIEAMKKKVHNVGGVSKTGQEWIETWSEKGVRGWGWVSGLVTKSSVDEYMNLLSGTVSKSTAQKAWELPANIATSLALGIEDNARIMVALDKLTKNAKILDPALRLDDAAKHSWKYLFQYDQLTGFEQGVAKRVFPFYTWMRKNIPLQVESLLDQPGTYSKMTKYYNALSSWDDNRPENEKFLPSHMRDFGTFRVPDGVTEWFSKFTGVKQPKNLYVNIDLPWKDLANVMTPLRTMLNALSPAALPLQLGLNSKSFPEPGTPIERFKGDLKPAPWPVTWIPEGVWPLLGIQPIRDRKTGKQILGMPAKAEFALTTLIPVLSEISKLYPQTAELEAEDAPWRKLRYVTGVAFTPIDFDQQQMYWALDRKNKLADVARYIRQTGRGLTTEELERFLK